MHLFPGSIRLFPRILRRIELPLRAVENCDIIHYEMGEGVRVFLSRYLPEAVFALLRWSLPGLLWSWQHLSANHSSEMEAASSFVQEVTRT